MPALPSVVKSSLGKTLHLAKQIGKGGEGAIYEVQEQSDVAIKLYWPNKAGSRRDKVAAMASAQWYKQNSFVAFPIDLLYSPSGAFVGFIMKKIGGSKPVHMLYSPASRKIEFSRANYRFLVRAAANIARAVASVHGTGCVIGDVNHSGFLVSEKATSIVIDSDSFQVVAANHKFLCQVGTPEYTPPELQGARFDRVTRTANHDNFGLAILIFQILFMGRHPFSGLYQGAGDMPLERAIGEYRFAYSANSSRTKMQPPPGAPLLTDFPSFIGDSFEKAFGQSGRTLRSVAADWVSALETLESQLVQCAADPSHQHVKDKLCPWCRMERASPGFVAFNPQIAATVVPIHIDVSQIAALIGAIRDPGLIPTIQTVLVGNMGATAAPISSELVTNLRRRAWIGIGASAAGAILISFGGPGIAIGLPALACGIIANAFPPAGLKKLREAQTQAERSWRAIQEAWSKQSGNRKFLALKAELNDQIQIFTDLPNEEKRQLQKLALSIREAQLKRHLDRYLIANAKISKVGSGRKAVLASFGVQTAGDIERNKVAAIQGFGPALVSSLITWRRSVESKFVFNPNEPINPNDIAAIKSRIAGRKAELETKIQIAASSLKQESDSSLSQRGKLTALANQTFAALKQTELNVQSVTGPLHKASKVITFCCIGLAAVGLIARESPRAPQTVSVATPTNTKQPEQTPSVPRSPAKEEPSAKHPPNITAESPPTQPRSSIATADNSNSVSRDGSAGLPSHTTESPESGKSSARRGEAADQLSLSKTEDIVKIQKRLYELGYLSSASDGKWGLQSNRALAEYRERAGLQRNDEWDSATERSLFGGSAPYAVRTLAFVGGWTNEPGRCGEDGVAPIRITASRAETSGGACAFNSVTPDGNQAWRVEAMCSAYGQAPHLAHVRLAVRGSILHWSSEQPETLYYRCSGTR